VKTLDEIRKEHDFFMSDACGAVSHGSADVLDRQVRVVLKQIVLRSAFCELAQDQLHGDSRAANDGLAQHDRWIDFDALGGHL